MSPLAQFVSGLVTMGFVTASLFFIRFWYRTREILFLAFGIAFLLFALNQALVAISGASREDNSIFYVLRLAGFGLLIAAIVMKNLKGKPPP